jgi:membrane protease YdiL (CAAX protease family)
MKRWPAWLVVFLAILAPLAWEIGLGAAAALARWRITEMEALAVAKIGFALLLALYLTLTRQWRATGFLGGWQIRRWGLLWPLWVAAVLSTLSAAAAPKPLDVAAWLVIAFAIGVGEEGIFRGVMIAALAPGHPRRAALVTAVLFGAMHLAGLVAPIDPRMIVAQAIAALGLGLVLGGARLLTGSIWPGIVAHTILDFVGLAGADSLTEAMKYSSGGFEYMLLAATIASLWGLVLILRVPSAAGDGGDLAPPVAVEPLTPSH